MNMNQFQNNTEKVSHSLDEGTDLEKTIMDSIKEKFQHSLNAEGGHFVISVRN
jgi:hypothetical protein